MAALMVAKSDKSKDEKKDAGSSSAPKVDPAVDDLQKRATQCLQACSAQFDK